MNIYERAKERYDLEVAYREACEKQDQIRYEWEIDSLIAELPNLIPDGLDWWWNGDDSFVRSHRNGIPQLKLAIGEYEINTLGITVVWNSDKPSLRVETWDYENECSFYITLSSADDPQWLSPPIFDAIYEYVRMTEEYRAGGR